MAFVSVHVFELNRRGKLVEVCFPRETSRGHFELTAICSILCHQILNCAPQHKMCTNLTYIRSGVMF